MKLLAIPEGLLRIKQGEIQLIQTQGDNAGGTIILREMLKGLEGHRVLFGVKFDEEPMIHPLTDAVEVA